MANKTLDSLCQDPDYVFSSMDNLYACAEASESLTGNLTDTVYQCLLEYCEKSDPDLLGCPAQVVTDSFEFGVGLDPYPYFADNNGYCDNINKQANTDIGGPGVYASYFIQIGLVLSIWLFLRFFRILPKVLRQLSWVGRKANKTQLSDITAGHSAKIANFFDKQNFVMKSILVELQETQCFFMIACQSVVLLSKNHNGIFSATNMVIVWVDHMIAGLCAAAGILPVVLGLWTLQRSNMCSGWVFFLSTATMITAECALYSVFREPKVSDMTSLRGTFPTSCGQHPPPLRYCTLDQIENTIIPVTAFVAVISPFCLSLYGVTAIMFFWPHIEKLLLLNADGRPRILQLVTTFKELWSKTWFKVLRGIMTFLIEAAFLLVALIYISCFALMISSADMAIIDWTSWGFGQFIAVTTWASVICKYVYWSIFGTESYTETRFGASAHLVQDDKGQSNDDPTNDPRHELKSTEEYISLAEQSKTDLEAGQISKKY